MKKNIIVSIVIVLVVALISSCSVGTNHKIKLISSTVSA
jgi:hypothetical protein